MIKGYDDWKLAEPPWYSDESSCICDVCGKISDNSRVCESCMNNLMDEFAFDYLCSSGIIFTDDDMIDRIDDDVDKFLGYCGI